MNIATWLIIQCLNIEHSEIVQSKNCAVYSFHKIIYVLLYFVLLFACFFYFVYNISFQDSGQPIPLVVESCVRHINLYGEFYIILLWLYFRAKGQKGKQNIKSFENSFSLIRSDSSCWMRQSISTNRYRAWPALHLQPLRCSAACQWSDKLITIDHTQRVLKVPLVLV